MYLWNISLRSKMKPRYFQVSLDHKIGPSIGERSRGGGLKNP